MKTDILYQQVLYFVSLLGLLLSCLVLSWWFHAAFNYGYAFFYDFYHIAAHIDFYAPKNDTILGLDSLSKREHIALFNQISTAVHQRGEGLENIRFYAQGSYKNLLHQAEIIHLQDVANLITRLTFAGIVLLIVTGGLLGYVIKNKLQPKLKTQLLCLSLLVLLLLAIIFILGPTQVFYQLHIWAFPAGHQWFFYYEESLMSTLMKAPLLFGGIAASISVGALLLFMLGLLCLFKVTANKKG